MHVYTHTHCACWSWWLALGVFIILHIITIIFTLLTLELTDSARLPGHQATDSPSSYSLSTEAVGTYNSACIFMWLLAIQTQVLVFLCQALSCVISSGPQLCIVHKYVLSTLLNAAARSGALLAQSGPCGF